MNDEQTQAQSTYDAAKRRLALCTPNDKVAEQEFGLAYRRMVTLGMSMPIKRKYRA